MGDNPDAVVAPPCTEEEFLALGFETRGFAGHELISNKSKVQYFRSLFGTSPEVLAFVWQELRHAKIESAKLDKYCKPIHLLLYYRWIRSYETEFELRTQFNFGEETLRKWLRRMAKCVSSLRAIVIDPNWDEDDELIYIGGLDGVHYPTDEPRPFSKGNSSYKRGGKAALAYEFVLSIHENKIKWVNGGYPAGLGDREIFKEKGLLAAMKTKQAKLGRKVRLIADDGYTQKDLYEYLSLRNEFDPRQVAYFKDRVLSRQEFFNGKTKNYRCLTTEFAHSHDLHQQVVESICVTLQYEMDLGLLTLFDAYP